MRRVLVCSVTAAGWALAARLPYEHRSGDLAATVRAEWSAVDALVVVGAVGMAVRATAPLLADKSSDPAVVCIDDGGRWVVPLCGGHAGGGNALATELAGLLGAEAVITTASDGAGLPALDGLTGWRSEGAVAGVMRRWLDGRAPVVAVDPALAAWPLPPGLPGPESRQPVSPGPVADGPVADVPVTAGPVADVTVVADVVVTDGARRPEPGQVVLRPASLVVGVGASTGADAGRLAGLVEAALSQAGLHPDAVGLVATLDRKADEPAVRALADRLGVEVRAFPSTALAGVEVPNPSAVVEAAVGTPSVAEAAALAAAGAGARLVVAKARSADSTVAVARRPRPPGHLSVVGLGPGDPALRTPAAAAAVRHAEVVIGYGPYVELASDLLGPGQDVRRHPIGAEEDRCREALVEAAGGRRVALVCSGDPGVFAMASLVLELTGGCGDPPVSVVPGVTAALAAAAVLGAPLGHDHAAISLSDLLTPWEVIERRLRAAADADLVVALYNPRSARRTRQLEQALAILGSRRPPGTPAAVVTDAGRPGQRVVRTTIGALDPAGVDMVSLVMVGSSATRWIGGRMVTPRGYRAAPA